tara:strand:- start:3982 stop:4728 length:747 start_codon:yes stop_codon:yes gene_type:complete
MQREDVLVVNFAVNERTSKLSEFCFDKLGLDNYITLKSSSGFRDKFLQFAELACESNYSYFLRTDADRLLFKGVYALFLECERDDTLLCVEGQCFDFLMNKYRGATPHLFSRQALERLKEDNTLMPDSQKPESRFIENITNNKKNGWKAVNYLTNLHDYEQYPSKVCNTLVNRIHRGHFHRLYDQNYLEKTKYALATREAIKISKQIKTKNSMSYLDLDLSYLDDGWGPLEKIESIYEHYEKLYERLK